MRLSEGENHVISERDGLAVCQIWARPDLSSEEGAKNAQQMVSFLRQHVLRVDTKFRGIIFDVRRAPPVFGPKTRETLAEVLAQSARAGVRFAVITGESATQILQFRSLCASAPSFTRVFDSEPGAVQWLRGSTIGAVSASRPSTR